MKRNLKKIENKLTGDTSRLYGDCNDLWGNCSELEGDCSGLYGDCTGIRGNIDECGVSHEERQKGIDIADLQRRERIRWKS